MAESLEKLLKQALVKRGADKADAAVAALGKLARKKGANREEILLTLKQVSSESPQTFARWHAFEEICRSVAADDHEWLSFLRDNLNNHEAVEYIAETLLRLFGQDAYPELVEIVLDKKRPAETRVRCLEALSEHCGRPFDDSITATTMSRVTEDMVPTEQLRTWMAAGFPPPAPIVVPTEDLLELGIELPSPYLKFLKKHRADEVYETDEGQWRLMAADELLADVNIDGQSVPAVKQLVAYAATLADVLGEDETTDDSDRPYPLQRLAAGWAIGTDSSGDLLYLDPADRLAVWIFHHDGGDVERVARSFSGWIRAAEPC